MGSGCSKDIIAYYETQASGDYESVDGFKVTLIGLSVLKYQDKELKWQLVPLAFEMEPVGGKYILESNQGRVTLFAFDDDDITLRWRDIEYKKVCGL